MRGNQKNKDYVVKWTPEFAYAIGLLTTDGNLSNDGRHLILVSKDKQLLKTFKNCLSLNCKIGSRKSSFTKRKDYYHVQFSNVRLYKYLSGIGLHPNKSKTIEKIKIPNKHFFDFLRGHFDGDGSFYSYWDPRWPNSFMFYTKFLSASEKHILWLRSKIKNLININGSLRQNRNLYQLEYAKRESEKLLSKMYYSNSIPYLKRKYYKIKKAQVLEFGRQSSLRC